MSLLLLFAFAAAEPDPLIAAWARCTTDYARPRLAAEPVEKIVAGSLAACPREEEAVRRSYVAEFGPVTGAEAFATVRRGVEAILVKRLTQAKEGRLPAPF